MKAISVKSNLKAVANASEKLAITKKSNDVTFNTNIKKMFIKYDAFAPEKDTILSQEANDTINSLITILVRKITLQSMVMTQHAKRRTIGSSDIQAVIRLLPVKQFSETLVKEATTMITKYNANTCERSKESKKRMRTADIIDSCIDPPKIERLMRQNIDDKHVKFRISKSAVIYLTAVVNEVILNVLFSSCVASDRYEGFLSAENIISACKSDNNLKHIYYENFI